MSLLTELYNQAKELFRVDSQERNLAKAQFIENRMTVLHNQYGSMSGGEIENRLRAMNQYSSQGVFNALSFANTDQGFSNIIGSQIQNSYDKFGLQAVEVTFSSNLPSTTFAFYSEDHDPKVSIVISPDGNTSTLPFTDTPELKEYLIDITSQYAIQLYKTAVIQPEELYSNFRELYKDNDTLFKKISEVVNYDLTRISSEIKADFNLENQLDKLLRTTEKNKIEIGKTELAIMEQLNRDGDLQSYLENRLGKRSLLTDYCKEQLMLGVEQLSIHKKQNQLDNISQNIEKIEYNSIESNKLNKPLITALAEKHETLFRKVMIESPDGNSHYWINQDESVKIITDRVSVQKLSIDSVQLALDAAIHSFGNELKISGSDEFKNTILHVIANNNEYSNIQLNNEELQSKLNELRGVKPLVNEISQSTENTITPSVDTHKIDSSLVQNTNKVIPAQNYILIDLATKAKTELSTTQEVIHYFVKHHPESQQMIADDVVVTTNSYLKISEAEPTAVVATLGKAINKPILIGLSDEIACKLENGSTVTYRDYELGRDYENNPILDSEVSLVKIENLESGNTL